MSSEKLTPLASKVEELPNRTFPLERWMFIPGGDTWHKGKGRSAERECNESLGLMSQTMHIKSMQEQDQAYLTQIEEQGFAEASLFTRHITAITQIDGAYRQEKREIAVNTMQQYLLDYLNTWAAEHSVSTVEDALSLATERNDEKFIEVYNKMISLNQVDISEKHVEEKLHDSQALSEIKDILSLEEASEAEKTFLVNLGKLIFMNKMLAKNAEYTTSLFQLQAGQLPPDQTHELFEALGCHTVNDIIYKVKANLSMDANTSFTTHNDEELADIIKTMIDPTIQQRMEDDMISGKKVLPEIYVSSELAKAVVLRLTDAITLQRDNITNDHIKASVVSAITGENYTQLSNVTRTAVNATFFDAKFSHNQDYYQGVLLGNVAEGKEGSLQRFEGSMATIIQETNPAFLHSRNGEFYIPSTLADSLIPSLTQAPVMEAGKTWTWTPKLTIYAEAINVSRKCCTQYASSQEQQASGEIVVAEHKKQAPNYVEEGQPIERRQSSPDFLRKSTGEVVGKATARLRQLRQAEEEIQQDFPVVSPKEQSKNLLKEGIQPSLKSNGYAGVVTTSYQQRDSNIINV